MENLLINASHSHVDNSTETCDLQPINAEINAQIEVLLVDDRDENLFTLEAVLKSPGYRVVKARSGDEALRYLLKNEPAVILMDVEMPDLDGFETARIIKGSYRTRDIPIIFVTALNKDDRFVHKGYDHGAVDYVYKPYDTHILKSKVAVFADLARKNRLLFEVQRQLHLTEKKERERQLAQLELRSLRREQNEQKKYLDLVEGINNGVVWSADTDSLSISFISPSAAKLFGFPLEQWSDESSFLMNHVHPDDQEKVRAGIKRVINEKINLDLDHRLIKADGSEVWLHTSIRLSSKSDDGGHELRGLSIDITKIKEAEEILKENKRRADFLSEVSLVLSETLDYLVALSALRNLVVPRIADCLLVHMIDEDAIIRSIVDAPDDFMKTCLDTRLLAPQISNVLKDGHTVYDSDAFATHIGASSVMIVPLIIRGIPVGAMTFLNTESGRHFNKYDALLMEDTSKRVSTAIDNSKLYQQAQSAIRVRDDFLSIASHELKTPLTPLKLQIQMLVRALERSSLQDIEPEKLDKMLRTSDRQIVKLSALIDGLMDVSRISNGKLKLEPDNFDLVCVIREIIDRYANEAARANCKVQFHANSIPSDQLMVFLDQFRIEQVIVNLLTNAIKYAPGKPIQISLIADENCAKIVFQDFGIGIPAKDLGRIFDRFERAVSGASFAGLGLGLYIVKEIVTNHGGEIDVKSEFGVGSTFTVTLPLKAVEKTL